MTGNRLRSALELLCLLGLAALFYGWVFYPPLAWPMAIASLAFLLALAVARIIHG